MGKRKERRLAAKAAAGRRVKLDLFAEPSGDMGGTAQNEDGVDDNPKSPAGLLNSPSSSGQRPENPLLLLGQYSDDELDEESRRGTNHATMENHSANPDDQVKFAAVEEGEGIETSAGKDLAVKNTDLVDVENSAVPLDASQSVAKNGRRETGATESVELEEEIDSTEQLSALATSDAQVVGDVSSGWKIVLHEESQQYYYWNTVTGETSWEVPDILAKGTELTYDMKVAADIEGRDNVVLGTHKSSSNLDVERSLTVDVELDGMIAEQHGNVTVEANANCETKEIYEHRFKSRVLYEGCSEILDGNKGDHNINGSDVKNAPRLFSSLHVETTSAAGHDSLQQSDDVHLGDWSGSDADIEKHMGNTGDHGENKTQTYLASHLLKYCEDLLERLKYLKGLTCHQEGQDRPLKYILEVEIRLSDINSLLSHGSSLLPFWLHSERRLKQLEAAIEDEFSQFYNSARLGEDEAKHRSQKSISEDIEVVNSREEKAVYCASEIQKASSTEPHNDGEHVRLIESSTACSGSGSGHKDELPGVAMQAESSPKTVLHSEEDIDMDVEMEVEDAIPSSNITFGDASNTQHNAPPGESVLSNASAEQETFALEEKPGVPPLPDEEWIPPPPPDELFPPPPPPDEPPEPSYPLLPLDSETMQIFSYTEQYNQSYPGSSFAYYGQANTEVQGSDLYAHAEGCQVVVSHVPLYYAAPDSYHGAAPVVVNPVEHVTYYGLQDGTTPPVPVTGGESSVFHINSGHESLVSDQTGFTKADVEPALTDTKVDISSIGGEIEKASLPVPFAPASVQAQASISLTESVPDPSTSAVSTTTVAVAAMLPKVQSKVSRNKKRAVFAVSKLRSNKKVSSLVDKWKAAKEELHEDEEDEPDDAFEMLGKKRQREIEEWRAQQIASGEAKDNANFQPLGGDWRERVKRKRAQLSNGAGQPLSEGVTDGSRQPDLNELARDLPSGWQAYWDESSKGVYYGNSVTMETCWVRPTNKLS